MTDNNRDLAGRWLRQAESDLEAAQWSAQGRFWANACFFSQQSGEKALKAYLYAHGEREVIGHSLLTLSRRCSRFDLIFQTIEGDCRRLDKYYITSRYPNGLPDSAPADYFDESEAQEAIAYAQKVVASVRQQLQSLLNEGEHDASATT
jgi:HEPN domain-containing protein